MRVAHSIRIFGIGFEARIPEPYAEYPNTRTLCRIFARIPEPYAEYPNPMCDLHPNAMCEGRVRGSHIHIAFGYCVRALELEHLGRWDSREASRIQIRDGICHSCHTMKEPSASADLRLASNASQDSRVWARAGMHVSGMRKCPTVLSPMVSSPTGSCQGFT